MGKEDNSKCISARIVCTGFFLLLSFPVSGPAQKISFDTDSLLHKIPPMGYNMITANRGFGIIGDDGKFDPDILASLVKMELPIFRFPGGTYANLYEWKRAIGAKETRGGMHGWKMIPDDNWFGPDEAARLMEHTKGELVIVVNFNKGAAYAADWVEYMNAEVGKNPNGGTDWAAVRSKNGHPAPYRVRYWEIANEGGNSRIWPRWPYNGDTEQLEWGDSVFQNRVVYGGTRSYTNQKLVRYNAWEDSYIKTKGVPHEVFQVRWYPVGRPGFTLKIGTDSTAAIQWTMVTSFTASGPGDRHYMLDETRGEVTFGDGTHGAVPPAGQYGFVSYTTRQLDGHVQIYNAMKAVDPEIMVADAFFFLRRYIVDDPGKVKYDGTQEHMAIETMGDFGNYYGDNAFTEAVAIASGGVPGLIDTRVESYIRDVGHHPNFFLTEYGIYKNTLKNGIEHARTITSSIYYALANAKIAERGEYIQMACINYLFNHGPNKESAMDEGESHVHANGITTEMFSKYFGDQLVFSEAQNIPVRNLTFDPLPWSTASSSQNVPKLYHLASVDRTKNKAYLMVINTTANETIGASVSSRSGKVFSTKNISTIKKLTAASLTASNSASNPDQISIVDESLPAISDNSFHWQFAPATVTSFIFSLDKTSLRDIKTGDIKHVFAVKNISYPIEGSLEKIQIFHVNGRMIREIHAAHGRVSWDGSDKSGATVGPGVYVARLIADHNTTCVKFVLPAEQPFSSLKKGDLPMKRLD
jgi:alpha-N-arabinofuranosidase